MLQKIKAAIRSDKGRRLGSNVIWLVADKVFRMAIGLIVGVWFARYVGPVKFGIWSYALAFCSIFEVVATLGLDSIVIRDIVRTPQNRDTLLGSAFVLKLCAGILTYCASLLIIITLKPGDSIVFGLVSIVSLSFIAHSFRTIDLHFQSTTNNRPVVIVQNVALLLVSVVKIYFLLYSFDLIAFAYIGLGEAILVSIGLVVTYAKSGFSISNWTYRWIEIRYLLRESWPLALASIAILLYMRIDQVMLGSMSGPRTVGIYSAAVRISEIWYFVPMALHTALLPTIVSLKGQNSETYYKRLQMYLDGMAFIGYSVAVITTIAGAWLVNLIYGSQYKEASSILTVLIWSGLSTCLGVGSSSWLTAEGLQMVGLLRTCIGCILNIILNFLLIPRFGAIGAAVATLISYNSSIFSVFFLKRSRVIGYMMLKALNPFRILSYRNLQTWRRP